MLEKLKRTVLEKVSRVSYDILLWAQSRIFVMDQEEVEADLRAMGHRFRPDPGTDMSMGAMVPMRRCGTCELCKALKNERLVN